MHWVFKGFGPCQPAISAPILLWWFWVRSLFITVQPHHANLGQSQDHPGQDHHLDLQVRPLPSPQGFQQHGHVSPPAAGRHHNHNIQHCLRLRLSPYSFFFNEQNHHDHHLGQVLGPVLGGLNLQATGRTLPHDEDLEVVNNKLGCCIHCKIKHIRSELYLRVRRVLPHFSQLQRWFLLYYLDHSVDHHIDHHHQHHFNHQTSWWWWVHVLDLERAGAPRSQRGDAPDDQEQGNQVHDMCLVFWWWWW